MIASEEISIHAPQWGATCRVGAVLGPHIHFNPRTPVGCDDMLFPAFFSCSLFQSTHPSGVRRICLTEITSIMEFQSTHPSGVRQALGIKNLPLKMISIHAPQWGATLVTSPVEPLRSNFNPRTPVGCDVRRNTPNYWMVYFNPRTPVGCDLKTLGPVGGHEISIHAPQWGATIDNTNTEHKEQFQSTHPSGVRPCACRPTGV